MEVTKNQIDDLNIELTIALKADDYSEAERKSLAAYKRKADFKGFRKGMAPSSLVKRIYGEQALYEAINGTVAEQLDKFIKDNNLKVLGERCLARTRKRMTGRMGPISNSNSTSACRQSSISRLTSQTNSLITTSKSPIRRRQMRKLTCSVSMAIFKNAKRPARMIS